jgi:hydrogenase/urease accessory protein HupE
MDAFMQYAQLGVGHILSGYDHLLFLFGLLIAKMTRTGYLKILTAFTLGHSVTLGLATLDIMSIPPSIIEPLIAASIVYVAVENIVNRNLKYRWLLTFGFGLVHGFGFADIMKGTLSNHIALSLFSFNFGVEIGQLLVLAIVFPFIWAIRQVKWEQRKVIAGLSGISGCLGLFWFVERVFFN